MIKIEGNRTTLENIFSLLEIEPLSPAAHAYVELLDGKRGVMRFRGAFANIWQPFSVVTDEPHVIRKFLNAIRANTNSDAFRKLETGTKVAASTTPSATEHFGGYAA